MPQLSTETKADSKDIIYLNIGSEPIMLSNSMENDPTSNDEVEKSAVTLILLSRMKITFLRLTLTLPICLISWTYKMNTPTHHNVLDFVCSNFLLHLMNAVKFSV